MSVTQQAAWTEVHGKALGVEAPACRLRLSAQAERDLNICHSEHGERRRTLRRSLCHMLCVLTSNIYMVCFWRSSLKQTNKQTKASCAWQGPQVKLQWTGTQRQLTSLQSTYIPTFLWEITGYFLHFCRYYIFHKTAFQFHNFHFRNVSPLQKI